MSKISKLILMNSNPNYFVVVIVIVITIVVALIIVAHPIILSYGQ